MRGAPGVAALLVALALAGCSDDGGGEPQEIVLESSQATDEEVQSARGNGTQPLSEQTPPTAEDPAETDQ